MRTFKTLVALAGAVVLLLAGCTTKEQEIAVTGITLSPTTLTLNVGESQSLTAEVQPTNATNKNFNWSTSDPEMKVIALSGNTVKGLAPGSATVIVTTEEGSRTATCQVTVKESSTPGPGKVDVSAVTLKLEGSSSLAVGESVVVKATVEPDNATEADKLSWSSDKPEVASVSGNAKEATITAVAEGKAKITATVDGKSATVEITVVAATVAVESISLDPSSATLKVGEEASFVATVKPDDASDKTVTWSSSDAKIASVSDNGKVTAVAVGTATITAKAGEKSAQCTITVSAEVVAVTSITLSKSSINLKKGESQALTATVKPDNATDKTVTWSSTDEEVATVDQNGNVTAVSVGMCYVKAQAGECTAKCTVDVQRRVAGLAIRDKYWDPNPEYFLDNDLHLNEGNSYQISNLFIDLNYDESRQPELVWTSEDPSRVSVSSSGLIYGKANTVSGSSVKPVRVWVATKEEPDAKDYVDVRVHSRPTAVKLVSCSNEYVGDRYLFKHGTSGTLEFAVEPATSWQCVTVTGATSALWYTGEWVPERVDNLQIKLTAPRWQSGMSEDFFNSDQSVKVSTVGSAYQCSKQVLLDITMWDASDVKPMDYVYYNSSTGKLRSSDGGLRSIFSLTNYVKKDVPPAPKSNEECVALITYLGDIPDEIADSQGAKCGLSNSSGTHGFAVATRPVADGDYYRMPWSQDNDDVDKSDNWRLSYPTHVSTEELSTYEWRRAFSYTIAASYYNIKRGSSHDIRPMEALAYYAQVRPVGTTKVNVSTYGYNSRWVLPTVGMDRMSGWNGKLIDYFYVEFDYNKGYGQNLNYFTRISPGDGAGYYTNITRSWTINTFSKSQAYTLNREVYNKNTDSGYMIRNTLWPFLIF